MWFETSGSLVARFIGVKSYLVVSKNGLLRPYGWHFEMKHTLACLPRSPTLYPFTPVAADRENLHVLGLTKCMKYGTTKGRIIVHRNMGDIVLH